MTKHEAEFPSNDGMNGMHLDVLRVEDFLKNVKKFGFGIIEIVYNCI